MSSVIGKRHHDGSSSNDEPRSKRIGVLPRLDIGPTTSLEELDVKTLRIQNKHFADQHKFLRNELKELQDKIEDMEVKEKAKKATLSLINRSWEQCNESIKVCRQRLDHTSKGGSPNSSEDEDTIQSLLRLSKSSEFSDIKKSLLERMEYSKKICNSLIDDIQKVKKQTETLVLEKIGTEEFGDEAVRELISKLQQENSSLNAHMTSLQKKHVDFEWTKSEFESREEENEDMIEELKNQVENLKWELTKARKREEKLTNLLADLRQQKQDGGGNFKKEDQPSHAPCSTNKKGDSSSSEEWQIIAEGRLAELETMKTQKQQALKEIEQLKTQLNLVPEPIILQSSAYKNLKSQFSVLFHECVSLKQALEDNRVLKLTYKNMYQKKMDKAETDSYTVQRNLRDQLHQVQDQLNRETQKNRVIQETFERNVAANEQAGPLNREMRQFINSMQDRNRQLFSQGQRLIDDKKKLEEEKKPSVKSISMKKEHDLNGEQSEVEKLNVSLNEVSNKLKQEETKNKHLSAQLVALDQLSEEDRNTLEARAELQQKLHDLQDELQQKNMQLEDALNVKKEENDDMQIGDHALKIKQTLESEMDDLRRRLMKKKTEQEQLAKECESVGNAYDDMFEQNARLMQQLKEKDDANFKLMAEKINSKQVQANLKKEAETLEELNKVVNLQLNQKEELIKSLEEKEKGFFTQTTHYIKQQQILNQISELNQKKAKECAQELEDKKRELESCKQKVEVMRNTLDQKIEAYEEDQFKFSRIKEDNTKLKKKVDKHKKTASLLTYDEVLMEENKEYKLKLTCPICNVQPKDTVLTKCYHVFCHKCIQKRYETRQRKCPKCQNGFGHNDFHKIYIE